MKHVLILLRKDLRENWVLFVIALAIPVLVMGVISVRTYAAPEIAQYEGSLVALEKGSVDALVDETNKTIYVKFMSPQLYEELTSRYAQPTGTTVIIHGEGSSRTALAALLIMILFWIMTIVTQPILMLADSKDGLHSALMMTNLTYHEYLASKLLFTFLGNVGLMIAFIAFFCGGVHFLSIPTIVIGACLSVVTSFSIAAFVKTEELLMMVMMPLVLLTVFGEVYLFISEGNLRSPFQRLALSVISGAAPHWGLVAGSLAITLVLYSYAIWATRRRGRG